MKHYYATTHYIRHKYIYTLDVDIQGGWDIYSNIHNNIKLVKLSLGRQRLYSQFTKALPRYNEPR